MSTQLKDSLLNNVASDNTMPQRHAQHRTQPHELEDLHISIGKRIYAQMDILVMFLNTINAVFSISAAVSLIPQYDYSSYTFCDYGSPIAIGVQCPYLPSPVFISFFVAWTLYFMTLITYQWSNTYDYWSNDLRFYIACDSLHNTVIMRWFVYIGILLTIVSAIGGIVYVCHNGTTSSLGNILVFTCVNMYNLSKMMSSRLKALQYLSLTKDFPNPVYIKLPFVLANGHMQGITVNHNEIFEYLYQSIAISSLSRESDGQEKANVDGDKMLRDFGDVAQLKQVAVLLAPSDMKK